LKCDGNKEEAGEAQRPSEMEQDFIDNQDTQGNGMFDDDDDDDDDDNNNNSAIIIAK
jgi:hypothetical protein